jgi:hypothetical protein
MGIGLLWRVIATGYQGEVWHCEYSNDPLVSIKCGQFLDQLKNSLTSQKSLCTIQLIITHVLYICTSRFLFVVVHSCYPPVRDHMVPAQGLYVFSEGCMVVTVTVSYREAPLGCSR